MESPNTFTYRHSEMPPMTDEIKSEIAEIDFNVANLLLKYQGHYRALSELAEILADCLSSCETNLYSIRIIPDGDEMKLEPRAIGLTDLPATEKQLLISTAITSTVAIKVLAGLLNCDFEQAASRVRSIGQAEFGRMSSDDIDNSVEQLAKGLRENTDGVWFTVEV